LTGGFPARGSPAARVEGCVSLTGSRRTSGCLESKLGRSERGCRRRAAACGSELGGGTALVRFGRGEKAWELREVEAVLMVGDVGVERVWVGGSAAG